MTHSIRLPRPFSLPAHLIPASLHATFITQIFNQLLSEQRQQGELDFLQDRVLCINIEDAAISFSISLQNKRLVAAKSKHYDMKISGTIHDFLLLSSRTEDADTLFFQRRLKMQGDTELGLYLKNFLDGMDIDTLPYYNRMNPLLIKGIRVYEQLFQKTAPGYQPA